MEERLNILARCDGDGRVQAPLYSHISRHSDERLLLVDPGEHRPAEFLTTYKPGSEGFEVRNGRQQEIVLLPLDNGYMPNLGEGVADALILEPGHTLIVELKVNVQGRSSRSVPNSYKKAVSQLTNVMEVMKEILALTVADFKARFDPLCFVVYRPGIPRINATNISTRKKFVEKYGDILRQESHYEVV